MTRKSVNVLEHAPRSAPSRGAAVATLAAAGA
jgi:hypothetical protein